MRLAEGMDHAHSGRSSERPAEHNEVERFGRVREALGPPNQEADAPREAPEPSAGGADSRRVRVNPAHDRPEAGEPQRQPPVAAADLEHMLASPLGDALERATSLCSGSIRSDITAPEPAPEAGKAGWTPTTSAVIQRREDARTEGQSSILRLRTPSRGPSSPWNLRVD